MTPQLVEKIADAVLYEGYMLYPYRPSAVKNRKRWNFGVVHPQAWSLASGGADSWTMQTECLVLSGTNTAIDVKVRFLHLVSREAAERLDREARIEDGESRIEDGGWRTVESLEVDGRVFHTWQEAVERDVRADDLALTALLEAPFRMEFAFPSMRAVEPLRGADARLAGALIRTQEAIEGVVEVQAERAGPEVTKITVRVSNTTPVDDPGARTSDEILLRALVSTHTIIGVRAGQFVSLLDPPESFREAAASCRNIGAWPVLVGEEGARDCMLSSPIILYDYPQVAPESAGDLFDSTEIDEILTLRIMTLTDDEKREMRDADDRARRILERTETLPLEQLMKLHGAVRGLRPVKQEGR